jgi:hypothetical protein
MKLPLYNKASTLKERSEHKANYVHIVHVYFYVLLIMLRHKYKSHQT